MRFAIPNMPNMPNIFNIFIILIALTKIITYNSLYSIITTIFMSTKIVKEKGRI